MNKLFMKIAKAFLGLSMAIGVGVAVGSNSKKATSVRATAATLSLSSGSGGTGTVTYKNTGYAGVKIGASSKTGTAAFTVASGSTSCSFFAAGWNGKSVTLSVSISVGSISPTSVSLTADSGVSGSTNNFTISGTTDSNFKKDFTLNNVTSSATISITTSSSEKRAAIWNANYEAATSYTISYNANGGSGTMSSTTGTSVSAAICTFTAPSNKHFKEWNESSTGSGTSYAAGATVNKTVTLYAIWAWDTFTVSYNSHGGSGTMTDSNSPYDYNSSVTILSCSFTPPSGKAFDHWDTKEDDSGIDYNPGSTFNITANTTLYAQWVNGYSVSMSVSGYTLSGTKSGKSGDVINDLVLSANAKYKLPTSISIAGYTVGTDFTYSSSTGAISILNLKADAVITFAAVNATWVLVASNYKTDFTTADDFSVGASFTVEKAYDDAATTTEALSSSEYTVDSSAYRKKAGTYQITVIYNADNDYYDTYSVTVTSVPVYEELVTITSGDIVNQTSAYAAYTRTVDGNDWVITFGGNKSSMGSNSNNVSKCNLGNYSKYAVSPLTTSVTATAFANTSSFDDVGKITFSYTGSAFVSGSSVEEVYLLYSSDNTTFSRLTLTSGTQGAALGAASTTFTFEFAKCSGYFALVFAKDDAQATGNWRIDNVSMTFYESVSSDPKCSITSTFDYLKVVGDNTHSISAEVENPEDGVSYTISYSSGTPSVATINSTTGALTAVGVGETLITVSADNGAASATMTLYVLSTHSGLTQNDALTTTEALNFAAHLNETDIALEYYITGILTEVTTATASQVEYPDYIFDNSDIDLFRPTYAEGFSESQMVVGRTVTFKGTFDGDSEDYYLEGQVVNIVLPTLTSISFGSGCDMSVKTYSSKSSYWKTTGLVVNANYQGEDPLDVTSEVEWSFSVGSPSGVQFQTEDDITNYSLTVTASYGGKTASKTISGITITFDGYVIKAFDGGWELVTDDSSLSAGDELVIGLSSQGKTAGSITSQYMTSLDSTFGNDEITDLNASSVVLTLGGSSGAWTLSNEEGEALGATAAKKLSWDSGTTTWSISISNGSATIQNGTSTYGKFLYNVTSPRFTTYTSDPAANMILPQLYRKAGIYDVEDDLITAIDTFYSNSNFTCDTTQSFDVESWNTYTSFTVAPQGKTESMLAKYHLNKIVANENGNKVEQFLAMYDYVIGFKKAGGFGGYEDADDFLNRYESGGIHYGQQAPKVNPLFNIIGENTNTVAIIVIISMVSVTAIGGYFFLRKRKENN